MNLFRNPSEFFMYLLSTGIVKFNFETPYPVIKQTTSKTVVKAPVLFDEKKCISDSVASQYIVSTLSKKAKKTRARKTALFSEGEHNLFYANQIAQSANQPCLHCVSVGTQKTTVKSGIIFEVATTTDSKFDSYRTLLKKDYQVKKVKRISIFSYGLSGSKNGFSIITPKLILAVIKDKRYPVEMNKTHLQSLKRFVKNPLEWYEKEVQREMND